MTAAPAFQVHVISHTHWDREWYDPAGRFRQRLVELIQELLDDPELSAERPFLLDGQAIVLADFLEVHPERTEALQRALASGAIEAGPWYVLADELIPSGEALVRNLLTGISTVRRLGGEPPPVLYSPDAFGHAAALPLLAAGFGFATCIVWRGLGGVRWPPGDTFLWSAAGATVLTQHLPRAGYEFGASMPSDADALATWWRERRAELGRRARTSVLLLLNGADHHARQRRLDRLVAQLRELAGADTIIRSSLGAFARAVHSAAARALVPRIEGELRDSTGHTWSLRETLGARSHLKRTNAIAERMLVRDAEPWTALAALRGGQSRAALVRHAWRSLLQCHPHDTLCGCASDAVARAMAVRLEDVRTQARGLRDDAVADLLGHDRELAREQQNRWRSLLVVRNRTARVRSGVAHVELTTFIRDVPVGPPSATNPVRRATPASLTPGSSAVQTLSRRVRHDRVESPRHYPDDDLVESERALVWIDDVPGYGLRCLRLEPVPDRRAAAQLSAHVSSAEGGDRRITNGLVSAHVGAGGELVLELGGAAQTVAAAFEDVGDAGDLYTHSPVGPLAELAGCTGARPVERGPLRAALLLHYAFDLPRFSDRSRRSSRLARTDISVHVSVTAGEPFVRLDVRGVNRSRDHRLRLVLRTSLPGDHVRADAAFGNVVRERAAPPSGPEESISATAPLARHVTIAGEARAVTLLSDGLAEYEATPGGDLAVTLLRAVGELSREDLPERPGHAGWPVPTPMAQVQGSFRAKFGVLGHAQPDPDLWRVEQAAEDFLLPLAGCTLRSALDHYSDRAGVELQGEGLAFSTCKEWEHGPGLVLRCVNLLDRSVTGRWNVAVPFGEAWLSRLDESLQHRLERSGERIAFDAPPRAVVTIVLRPR